MNIHQRLSAFLVLCSVVNVGVRPLILTSALLVFVAVALYAFAILHDKKQHDELLALQKITDARLDDLKKKVDDISLARGMGR